MECPRCRAVLEQSTIGSFVANGCNACGGLWLDNATSQLVVTRLDDEALAFTQRLAASASRDPGVDPEVACPECQQPLTRKRIAPAWLDLDICLDHGTWFDAGEIERVAKAFTREPTGDWRAPPPRRTAPAAPAPAPMRRLRDDIDHDAINPKNPYLRGVVKLLAVLVNGGDPDHPEHARGTADMGQFNDGGFNDIHHGD